MTTIVALDAPAIESQQLRLGNATKSNHAGMLRILKALEKQLAAERLLYLQAGAVRSKRRVILSRRQDIIDKLVYEIDTMSMSCLEASNLEVEFEQMRYHHSRCLTDYVQYTEERLAVQKEKALIRMTGFARNVIDDVNEDPVLARNNRSHQMVHLLQSCTLQLAADGVLPRVDEVERLFQHLDEGPIDPIVLFNAMQLLDVLCSQNWSHGKNPQIDEQRNIVHRLIKLIPYAFTFLRTWTEENFVRVPLFIAQLFQALKAALTILSTLNSVSAGTLPPTTGHRRDREFGGGNSMGAGATFGSLTYGHTVSTASYDNSSTPQDKEVHYFEWCDPVEAGGATTTHTYTDSDLATDLVLWLKVFKYAKLGYFDSAEAEHTGLLNTFCAPQLKVPAHLSQASHRPAPTVQAYVVKELSILLSTGSALVTHALQCAEMVTHLLVTNHEKASLRAAAAQAEAASSAAAAAATAAMSAEGMQPQDSLLTLGTGLSQRPAMARRISSMLGGLPQATAADAALRGQPPPDILPAIPVFGTPAHALLLAAMELGVLTIGRIAVRLGPQGCTAGIAFTHMRFLKAVDAEMGAALRLAMMSFSLGLPDKLAFTILRHGYDLAVHRWASYFFVLPWLHCTLAAVLWCVEKEAVPEEAHARGIQEMRNRLKRAESTLSVPTSSSASAPAAAPPRLGSLPVAGTFRSSLNNFGAVPSSNKYTFGRAKEPPLVLPKVVKAISTLPAGSLSCPTTSAFCPREAVIQHASDAALRIMTVAAHLRHLMSVVHVSLILVRLLLRDLFIKRMRIEELMEVPLLTLLIPVLDLQTALALETTSKDSDEEREKEKQLAEQSIQDLTLRTPETGAESAEPSMYGSSVASPPGSPQGPSVDAEGSLVSGVSAFSRASSAAERGGGSRSGSRGHGQVPLVPQYWKAWVATHLEEAFTNGEGYPSQRLTFVGFLVHVGETHLQSKEVVEQMLLMVDHLVFKSQVCKFQLVDHGMPLVVHRIRSGQSDNVYMMALSEVVAEDLELKI